MVVLKRINEMSAASDSVQLVRLFNKNHEDFYKKYKQSEPAISPRVSELLIRDIINDLKENKYPNYKDIMLTLLSLMFPLLKKKDQRELKSDLDSLSSAPKNNTPSVAIPVPINGDLGYDFYTAYIPVKIGSNNYFVCLHLRAPYIDARQDQFPKFPPGRWSINYPVKQTPEQIAKMIDDKLSPLYKSNPSLKDKLGGLPIGVYLSLAPQEAGIVVLEDARHYWKNPRIESYTNKLITGDIKVSRSIENGKFTLSVDSISFKVVSEEVDENILEGMSQELKSILRSRYKNTPKVTYSKTQNNPPMYRIDAHLSTSWKAYGDGGDATYIYTYTQGSDDKAYILSRSQGIVDGYDTSAPVTEKEKDPIKFSKWTSNVTTIKVTIENEWD